MNPFLPAWAAERYAASRPRIHRDMLMPLRARYGLELPARRALDLGCGTGLSARALADVATVVLAADVSRAMLRAAVPDHRVSYLAARAEGLPLASDTVDLATVGCTLHWLEAGAAFDELRRVLRPGALLAIYDNGFLGVMRESDAAGRWLRSAYLARYPPPPRQPKFRPERTPAGFRTELSEDVEVWVSFTLDELVRYLTTQSNVIDPVESGRETVAEVEAFLDRALRPFFDQAGVSRAHFRFGGPIFVLRRAS